MEKRSAKDYTLLMLKGMGMGAADVVPGVSGGTIAFIVGIYDELIDSIKSINMHSLKLLFTGKITAFWKAINANFLLSLLFGIAVSILSLAKLMTYLLTNEPVLVWSFFFGLVLASTWFVSKDIKELENDIRFYRRSRNRLLYYDCYAGRDIDEPALYFSLWGYCHLCHDIAWNIGQFHFGIVG